MALTKLSTDKDVWEYDASDVEGIEDLEVEDRVWEVTFTNPENQDVSTRGMFSHQMTCTIAVAKGWTGEDDVVIRDQSGNEVEDHIVFSEEE